MTTRRASLAPDGTWIRNNADDAANEKAAAERIEKAWSVKLTRYPSLHPVDFFAERNGRMVGEIEYKRRNIPPDLYETVYLNYSKYRFLLEGELSALEIRGVFVVEFNDGSMRSIRVTDIPPTVPKPRAGSNYYPSGNSVPVIEIPISEMKLVDGHNRYLVPQAPL